MYEQQICTHSSPASSHQAHAHNLLGWHVSQSSGLAEERETSRKICSRGAVVDKSYYEYRLGNY